MIEVDLAEASQSLRCILDNVRIDAYENFEAFFAEATLAFHEFPKQIRSAVNAFARGEGNQDGALFLRGFPMDRELPPTPAQPFAPVKKITYASEFWLCCIASVLGEPVAYLQEKQGSIFHNIYPTQGNAEKLSSESSTIDLDFHTEIAFHPFLPDYLLLYGLRQDQEKSAKTCFSGIGEILPHLTVEEQEILFEPIFRTGIDYSYGSKNGMKGNGPLLSVLYGNPQYPFLRYDLDLMVGLTSEAQHVLQTLQKIVYLVKQTAVIEPGAMLIVDNRRCVHSRSRFQACYDGWDRWLQRMLVVRDLEKSFADRVFGTRIIATDFSQYLQQEN